MVSYFVGLKLFDRLHFPYGNIVSSGQTNQSSTTFQVETRKPREQSFGEGMTATLMKYSLCVLKKQFPV